MRRILTGVTLIGLLAGCGASGSDTRQKCLYDAVRAYPNWHKGDEFVLDDVKPCKDLPEEDKETLRETMAQFVIAAVNNSQKGN